MMNRCQVVEKLVEMSLVSGIVYDEC